MKIYVKKFQVKNCFKMSKYPGFCKDSPAASHWSGSVLSGRNPAALWGSAPPRTPHPAAPALRLRRRRRRAAAARRGASRSAAWSSAWSLCAATCGPFPGSQIVVRSSATNTFLCEMLHLLAPPYSLIFFTPLFFVMRNSRLG